MTLEISCKNIQCDREIVYICDAFQLGNFFLATKLTHNADVSIFQADAAL